MANTHAPTFERILNQSSAHSKANSRETKSSTTPSPAALARAERLLCTNRVQLNKRFVVFLGQEVTTYSHYQYTPAPPIADNGDLTDDELAYSGCYANPHGLVVLCEAALRRMESSEPWD